MKNIVMLIFLSFTFNAICQNNKIDSATFYYNRAITKNNNKNYSGAIDDCVKSRQLDCNAGNSNPALLAGMIYFNSGDFKTALSFFKSASSLYIGRVMRGRCEYELKNYHESFYQLNLAIYENNSDPSAFFYRGLSRIEMNDINGAMTDLGYVASFKNQYKTQAENILNKFK